MPDEAEYRRLLNRSQACLEEVGSFLAAMRAASHADEKTRELSRAADGHLLQLGREVEQLWDHFKRLTRLS